METLQRKLTHTLYYRETGKPLTKAHSFQSEFYQIQGSDNILTRYFGERLPNQGWGEWVRNQQKNFSRSDGRQLVQGRGSSPDFARMA